MAGCNEKNVRNLLQFLEEAPYEEEIVKMDCNDFCVELTELAEKVASGADLTELLPALKEHMHYWTDCREEFEALVRIIQAEQAGQLPTEQDKPASQ
jgi:hypothetical protein